ncbi:MAG: hypothetical protein H0X40_07615 [Chthoniobacterales bacterium]|nr:hypothetical protein [Chthoniobacterales bacterium]
MDLIIFGTKAGRLKTAQKNAAGAAVVDALDKDASFTDIISNGGPSIIMQIGYEPVSTNRAQNMLNPPEVVAIETPQAAQLKLRVRSDRNTKSFVGRIKKATDGDYGPTVSFASSRKVIFTGLLGGVTYVMQLMVIGGTTGQSDWSDPVQGMPK